MRLAAARFAAIAALAFASAARRFSAVSELTGRRGELDFLRTGFTGLLLANALSALLAKVAIARGATELVALVDAFVI